MPGEKRGDLWRLRGRKAEPVLAVMTDEPTHRAIAQAAVAIEDDQQAVVELVR